MKLLLSNNTLTQFFKSGEYAKTVNIPLDGALGVTASNLLAWLASQLNEGEQLDQVMLERSGEIGLNQHKIVGTDGFETTVPTAFRPSISAAVSVTAPLGSRTFVVSSESLPEELRDGLVAAWGALSSNP
jgi:hypothetical protein